MGLVSVLMDAFPADSPWHCVSGSGYAPGAGPASNGALTGDSAVSWGAAGMAGWGSTCGIAIGCAQFAEFALPRGVTNGVIDKIFARFANGLHPFNEEWFISGKLFPRPATDFQIKYGTLQCHNVVAQHRNRDDFLDCGFENNPDGARSEFCGTLVGAICYETMKQVGAVRQSIAGTPFTPFDTTRNGCAVAGCHNVYLPLGFMPKENCYACHK
jgi:hypothetical protein